MSWVAQATVVLLLVRLALTLLLLFVLLVGAEHDLAVERQSLEQEVEPLTVFVWECGGRSLRHPSEACFAQGRNAVRTRRRRVPVSQNTDIKVELTGKIAPTKRDVDDKRGLLAWEMKLEPDEERAIEFGYRATWPAAKVVTYGPSS